MKWPKKLNNISNKEVTFFMVKYSLEFKLEVIKNILKNWKTYNSEGIKFECKYQYIKR